MVKGKNSLRTLVIGLFVPYVLVVLVLSHVVLPTFLGRGEAEQRWSRVEITEYGSYKPHDKYMKKGYMTADEIDASNAEFDILSAEKKNRRNEVFDEVISERRKQLMIFFFAPSVLVYILLAYFIINRRTTN